MTEKLLYKIKIQLCLDFNKPNVWYANKEGVEYENCFLEEGFYYINTIAKVPRNCCKVLETYYGTRYG
jgi:hypothetical protein